MVQRLIEFIPGIVAAGLPEYSVSDISSVEVIDGCMIRFTMVSKYGGLYMPQCNVVWPIPSWVASNTVFHRIRLDIEGGLAPAVRERLLAH